MNNVSIQNYLQLEAQRRQRSQQQLLQHQQHQQQQQQHAQSQHRPAQQPIGIVPGRVPFQPGPPPEQHAYYQQQQQRFQSQQEPVLHLDQPISYLQSSTQRIVPVQNNARQQSRSTQLPFVAAQLQTPPPPPPTPPLGASPVAAPVAKQPRARKSGNAAAPTLPQTEVAVSAPAAKVVSHLEGLKAVPNPPGLDLWRERLFNVDEMVVLSEEQYQTYFPHVDNVYSHRSTQRYKKKPFISHYWDCRLKGRPGGTPKSEDPAKRKRKRVARERDLCDVKIKITELLPGATLEDIAAYLSQQPRAEGLSARSLLATAEMATRGPLIQGPLNPAVVANNANSLSTIAEPTTERFYTIQRVNGTAPAANEEVAGGHRHSLEESDRIKKNTILRSMLKEEKEKKKSTPHSSFFPALSTPVAEPWRKRRSALQLPTL